MLNHKRSPGWTVGTVRSLGIEVTLVSQVGRGTGQLGWRYEVTCLGRACPTARRPAAWQGNCWVQLWEVSAPVELLGVV